MEFEVKLEKEKSETKPKLQRDVDKEIEYFKERIQFYKDKLKDLGYSEEINEMINYYRKSLKELIN
jgi:hypothetical protein